MNKKTSLICLLSVTGLFVGMPEGGLQAGKLEKGMVDTGLGQGSPYKYRLNANVGYDSRVETDANGSDQGSPFTDVSVGVSRDFGSRRTHVNFDASAGTSYFWDVESDQTDINLRLTALIEHQISRRLDVSFNTVQAYQVEPDFFSGTGRNSRSGQYYYTNNALQFGMAWTRKFSTVTSYSLAATRYEEEEFAATEDRLEHYFAQEFNYLVLPTTTLVLEYRLGIIQYDENPQNSTSQFALAGVNHTFNRRLSVNLRGGVEFRDYDTGESTEAPYGEAVLSYAYGDGSTLSWVTRYGLEQSEIVGPTTNTTLRTGIQINQKLTGKLNGRLGVFYENTQFDSLDPGAPIIDPATGLEVPSDYNPDYSEDMIDFVAGLSYALHRNISLDLGYSYTNVSPDQPANDYERHRVMLGLGFSF